MNKTKEYQGKRDFRKTPEPKGKSVAADRKGPIFVIQEHDARSRHFDFRLEVDGVLKSWAVPKGPSTDPREKRLAIPTEDHPLDYADFEGMIPEDQYGGGTVLVWDRGTYRNITTSDKKDQTIPIDQALEEGHAVVELHGQKIKGGYALERFRDGEEEAWLLIKTDDAKADARRKPVNTQKESVVSGRTLEEIATEKKD